MTCTVPGCGAPARPYMSGRRCKTHAPTPAPPTPPTGTTADELAAERDRRTRTRHEGKLP